MCAEVKVAHFPAGGLVAPQYQQDSFKRDSSKTVLSGVWESGIISAGPGLGEKEIQRI